MTARRLLDSLGVNRRVGVLAFMLAAALLALNLYAPASPTAWQRFLAGLLIVLCSLPTLMWASNREWRHSIMPFVGGAYALYFASPVFLRNGFWGYWLFEPLIEDSLINTALLLALGGWVLLMVGYFAVFRGRLARKLPRVNVLPEDGRRPALVLAVALGLVAAPFLYLDNSAVAAFYSGREFLPSAVAFPVHLVGQLTVLSILILFYLQRRGELGPAGRAFMWGLVAYYVLSGLSTGLLLTGITAVIALFVAYAVAAPAPTWRMAGYAALAAAVFLLVLAPVRDQFRFLTWTHGVEANAQGIYRVSSHEIIPGSEEASIRTSDYDVSLSDNVLTYSHRTPDVCYPGPEGEAYLVFFLHLYPVDAGSLSGERHDYGYDALDFRLSEGGRDVGGRCVHQVRLPDYDIERITTGLFWLLPQDAPDSGADEPEASLAVERRVTEEDSPLSKELLHLIDRGSYTDIDEDGEWQLRTADETTWEIDTSALNKSRLLIAAADETERAALAAVEPGDTVLVVADSDNWSEYLVGRALERGVRVHFWLDERVDSAGDRSSLVVGASATLYYLAPEPEVVTARDVLRGAGNPEAERGSLSLAGRVGAFMETVQGFVNPWDDSSDSPQSSPAFLARRLDMLTPLAWLTGRGPEDAPRLGGETYLPILFKPVPRFIYGDKPADVVDIGQRYGFLPRENTVNAFKIHQVGELYVNFSVTGVLLGMLVLGIMYGAVRGLFFHSGASVVTMAAGAHALTELLVGMEDLASVSWGFLLWYGVLLAVLGVGVRVVLRARRRRAVSSPSPGE